MKTRITKHVVVCCFLLLAAGVGLNGCNPDVLPVPASEAKFSSIRVMNFAECSPRPYDLYIYQDGSRDSVIVRALPYGVGAAYATNLRPGIYKVQLRPINLPHPLRTLDIEVGGGIQRTAVLWPKSGEDPELDTLRTPDRNIKNPDPAFAYIRVLNTKNAIPAVRVAIDNPLNDPIFERVDAKSVTDYVRLRHALDTNYTIYLTGIGEVGKHQIISRLAGASFAPGNFYTVVLGGNDNDCRDTAMVKQDTLRVRYFDDNEAGNELTFPTPQSLRFNVVNNLINPQVLKEGQRSYDEVGVVINNEDRYLIPRMRAHDVGPVLQDVDSDPNVIPTGFYTIPWTDAVLVSMYKVDGVTGQQRGTKLVNTIGTTMPNERIKSDEPFSIVVMDIVSSEMSNGFPDIDAANLLVPLPTVAHPDSITLVLVNGLVSFRIQGQPTSASSRAKFTINGIVPSYWSTPQASRVYSVYTIHKDALMDGDVVVVADIGRTTPVQTVDKTFKAQPGGVYEIVLVGQRENPTEEGKPKLLILHTNPKRSGH